MNINQVPGPKDALGVFDTINGVGMIWTDKTNLTHYVVGADIIPAGIGGGVRLLWTLCEMDVPADAAFLQPKGWMGEFDVCPTCESKRT